MLEPRDSLKFKSSPCMRRERRREREEGNREQSWRWAVCGGFSLTISVGKAGVDTAPTRPRRPFFEGRVGRQWVDVDDGGIDSPFVSASSLISWKRLLLLLFLPLCLTSGIRRAWGDACRYAIALRKGGRHLTTNTRRACSRVRRPARVAQPFLEPTIGAIFHRRIGEIDGLVELGPDREI